MAIPIKIKPNATKEELVELYSAQFMDDLIDEINTVKDYSSLGFYDEAVDRCNGFLSRYSRALESMDKPDVFLKKAELETYRTEALLRLGQYDIEKSDSSERLSFLTLVGTSEMARKVSNDILGMQYSNDDEVKQAESLLEKLYDIKTTAEKCLPSNRHYVPQKGSLEGMIH